MKFLIDENVHFDIFTFLKERDFDVISIAQDYSSIKDRDVLDLANKEGRIIITNDKDFGYLIYNQKLTHKGIVLFRLKTENPRAKIRRLESLIESNMELRNKFIVITEDRIRIRSKN